MTTKHHHVAQLENYISFVDSNKYYTTKHPTNIKYMIYPQPSRIQLSTKKILNTWLIHNFLEFHLHTSMIKGTFHKLLRCHLHTSINEMTTIFLFFLFMPPMHFENRNFSFSLFFYFLFLFIFSSYFCHFLSPL